MANSHITAAPCRAYSHMPCCVSAKSSLKFLPVAGRSRTARLLLIALVLLSSRLWTWRQYASFPSSINTSCGWDQQRRASRSSFEMYICCFQYIKFHDNPFRHVRVLLFTRMFNFNHHNSLTCLKAILRKRHLFFETPFGCLSIIGLTYT